MTPHSVCSHVVPIYFHQWPAGCSANPADGHDTCPKGRARNHYDIVGSAGSSDCTTRSRCLQSQDRTTQPAQTAPPGNLSLMPASSGDQVSPHGPIAGAPVQTQDFSHLGLKPGPQRPPRNPLSVSTNTGPRPSMSPQEQQQKRLKESNPTTLPPGNWRQEFGVYDPYSRNIETPETSEDESRHAPPTDNEAPFNAFGAAAPRNVPDTTSPTNVPDTAAVSLTSEQTEIRAWFRAHQDRICQLDDGFIRWLSRLLDQNQITPAEMGPLRMLTYRYQDYAQHGSVDTREEVFYVLPLPHFRKTAQIPQSEPPAPRRAFPGHPTIEHVTLVHATTVGGLKGIFNSGKISPSILHDPDSMSFFALGARRTGDPKGDSQELTRILHNGWHASKNACNVLLVAVGWGTGENIDVGGEHPCIQKTKDGGIVHHRRAKLWVCHADSHLIHGIAFCSTATDPEAPF